MPQITKEYKFCAAHKYWNDKWDEEKNYEVFGDDIYNHGHNYILRITVKGNIDPDSGFIVNLMWLNKIVNENVIKALDHKQIDVDIDWFKDTFTKLEDWLNNILESKLFISVMDKYPEYNIEQEPLITNFDKS